MTLSPQDHLRASLSLKTEESRTEKPLSSLKETNARFWDAVETLRLENPSAAAIIDEAMKTGGKFRVEVDDRYATSTKTPRAPKTSGAPSHTTLQVSKPKSPSEPSSDQKPSKKAKSKARAPSPEPSDEDPSDSSQDNPPSRKPRAPSAPGPPGDSSSEEDDPKPPRPSKSKPKSKDRRKSYGEAAFLYEEDPSEPDDSNLDQDQDFSNSTIALMLRSDRGAQAFPTAKDRQNKDSIPHMVVEFILKHRNISAVFYFIKAHLVRLQVTWYAMVNYLT
jgi:hypothetical protein